jgi:hypothetical protein
MQSCQATLATIDERLRLYYEISGIDLLHPSGVESEAASQAAAAAKEAQRTKSASDASSIVITPSPQQLAALGLNDTDLLNVRTYNTRVHAAKRAEVHEVEAIEAPVASEGDFLTENKGIAISGDGGKANELPIGTDLSVQNEVFFADEGHDAARNSIKKQAQRNADSHKRSSLARNKESSGGGGGGFTSTATQEKNESKSGKQVRKIAGPPRHTY